MNTGWYWELGMEHRVLGDTQDWWNTYSHCLGDLWFEEEGKASKHSTF